jgi:hypothetical protein
MAQIEESVARYLHQLDSADRQEPSLARATKTTRLKEKIAKLKEEMQRLHALEAQMLATPDQQISLTDPDARSMATSGRGSGSWATMSRLPSARASQARPWPEHWRERPANPRGCCMALAPFGLKGRKALTLVCG